MEIRSFIKVKFIAAAGCLLFQYAAPSAAAGGILGISGELHSSAYTSDTRGGNAAGRASLGISVFPEGNLSGVFSGEYLFRADSSREADSYSEKFRFREAYLRVGELLPHTEIRIGRQFYGDAGSSVLYFGPGYYTPEALESGYLDAASLNFEAGGFRFKAVYAVVNENEFSRAYRDGDYDVYVKNIAGFQAGLDMTESLSADIYMYDNRAGDNPAAGTHLGIYGGQLAFSSGCGSFSAGVFKNYQGGFFRNNNSGWAFRTEGNYEKSAGTFKTNARLAFFHAERDYSSYGDYAPGLVLSFYDPVSVPDGTDKQIINPGLDLTPAFLGGITVSLDYLAVRDGGKWFGGEYDITAAYRASENIEFQAGAGLLDEKGGEGTRKLAELGFTYYF